MPRPTAAAVTAFERLVADDPRLSVRPMFGQRSAFVRGKLCFGTFGDDLVFRLSPEDQRRALKLAGTRPFEPMAGRVMSGYLVLAAATLARPAAAREWKECAIRCAESAAEARPARRRR